MIIVLTDRFVGDVDELLADTALADEHRAEVGKVRSVEWEPPPLAVLDRSGCVTGKPGKG